MSWDKRFSTRSPPIRMQRVKQLLTETDLSLADIADRAGFSYVEYLSTSFRRQTGQSPSAYRRKFRAVGPSP